MSDHRNMLLLSSSRSATTGFLEACADELVDTLQGVKRALFVSYAVVGDNVRERLQVVDDRFREFGITLQHITEQTDPVAAIQKAEALLVSGGNTFRLLDRLYRNDLMQVVRDRVRAGMPYVGWSAGSNVAGASIRTTNDMPIVQPPSLRSLGLLSLQLNPHFTDAMPSGLRGETREDRLREFLAVHPDQLVIGLPEGDALRIRRGSMRLCGSHDAWLFRANEKRIRLEAGRDLSHLL